MDTTGEPGRGGAAAPDDAAPPPEPRPAGSSQVLTLANQLTFLRMALAPTFLALVLGQRLGWAAAAFVLAGITDLLDGLIARLGKQQTLLGAMLDPIADKILLASAFVALTWGPGLRHPIPPWLTVIVLSRDAIIVVTVSAINLTFGRRMFFPSRLGKVCTFFQLLTAGVALLVDAVDVDLPALDVLFHVTLVLTVASALHYVYLATTRRSGQAP